LRWNWLFLLTLLFAGCDEFALKKTATIRKISGTVRFEPAIPRLSLSLTYDMVNTRDHDLHDVYFYCHEAVTIDRIYDGTTPLRLEQGTGIGLSIKVYRVRVNTWLPNTRRLLRMEAHITGDDPGHGLVCSQDLVYLDSQAVWVPVSFDQLPAFPYDLTVETPPDYRAIMGARKISEAQTPESTLSSWQSQSTNLSFTGRLVIGRFDTLETTNLTVYLPSSHPPLPEKRLSTLLSLAADGQDILTRYGGPYPFTDIHLVFIPSRAAALEPWTDGLFSANMILLDESLLASLTNQRRSSLDDALLLESQWVYLLKVILHEMSHAYIGYGLRWEKDDTLALESLTESTSLKLLEWLSPETYRLAINRLLYDWRATSSVSESPLRTYLQRNLLLTSSLSPRDYFRLLRGLRGRYLYTLIDERALEQTLLDQGVTNLFSLASSWSTLPRWQTSLQRTNSGVVISTTSPVPLPLTLSVETRTLTTNLTLEVMGSTIVPLPWKNPTTIALQGDFQWMDSSAGDDILSDQWQTILSNLTLYYAGSTNIELTLAETNTDPRLRLPREDRFLSLVALSTPEIVYHRHETRSNITYLYAYKQGKNAKSTYALFVFRTDKKRWYWEGVYDPSLDYKVTF